jgi:hypothetical protein
LDGLFQESNTEGGLNKVHVKKLENVELGAFTIGILMNKIFQFKTITGIQSCYIVNKLETFNVFTRDGVSSSAISTSSHQGMALLV